MLQSNKPSVEALSKDSGAGLEILVLVWYFVSGSGIFSVQCLIGPVYQFSNRFIAF